MHAAYVTCLRINELIDKWNIVDGFGVHSREYYRRAYELLHPREMCEILVAEYEGKPIAALFAARHGDRAYYLYGASTDEERNRMPTYLLQWEAMKWAKAGGCE